MERANSYNPGARTGHIIGDFGDRVFPLIEGVFNQVRACMAATARLLKPIHHYTHRQLCASICTAWVHSNGPLVSLFKHHYTNTQSILLLDVCGETFCTIVGGEG